MHSTQIHARRFYFILFGSGRIGCFVFNINNTRAFCTNRPYVSMKLASAVWTVQNTYSSSSHFFDDPLSSYTLLNRKKNVKNCIITKKDSSDAQKTQSCCSKRFTITNFSTRLLYTWTRIFIFERMRAYRSVCVC